MRLWWVMVVLLILLGVGGWFLRRDSSILPTVSPLSSPIISQTEVIAEHLQIPWAVAFLPDGGLLVTVRPGQLTRIDTAGNQQVIALPEVTAHRGEGGLLGLTLHPRFAENNFLYLYRTYTQGGSIFNRVERYRFINTQLRNQLIILDRIPGSSIHDGGALAFGPDGKLYITTGDAGTEEHAQDRDSLAGKILRVNDDGTVPPDNPFGTAVYSYGHRNPQGLTWDSAQRLWATEHGRSGVQSGLDELNVIEPGNNYGWPTIEGDETHAGMVSPVIHSGPDETWAPAGLVFIADAEQSGGGRLFFGGLRGESLYEARIDDGRVLEMRTHLASQFGRIRAVALGPDTSLYITTSNTDGRGTIQPGDDKIIRVDLDI